MKGDFTRFTFQPQKHYSSVLMQQGRLQLDADWNEQMSILNYLNQVQARDMIGAAAGTSQTQGGYQILPAIVGESIAVESTQSCFDLLITEGRFYIDGMLCELNRGTAVPVEWRSPTQVQIPAARLDGQLLATGQWVEVEVPQGTVTSIKLNRIAAVNPTDFTLDLEDAIAEPPAGQSIKLRRLTTYTTQANYRHRPSLSPDAIYLVYLDVWQRHVTALDDRDLQEVALNGLDTTTRLQTIAQVKLLDLTQTLNQPSEQTHSPANRPSNGIDFDSEKQLFRKKPALSALETLSPWQTLSRRSVSMTASSAIDPTSAIDRAGTYQGGDNRLYRVEIHQGGAIDQATFKWSRDNGSIVSAIAKIEGDVVYLKGSIQDEYKLFGQSSSQSNGTRSQQNPWVEIISEAQELDNQPGILVQIRDVKPPNLLLLDPSQIQGTALPKITQLSAEQEKFKVRRWEGQQGTNFNWQLLERGIQIQFGADSGVPFQTGDYWLISARADQPIAWARDLPQGKQLLGKPIAQPPLGIQHRYGILAVVKTHAPANGDSTITFSSAIENDDRNWTQSDLRTKFLPLIDRGNASGIGTQPEARLHVRGDEPQSATGKIKLIGDNPQRLEITETDAQIFKGYTLSIAGKTSFVSDASRAGVLRVTLSSPLDTLPPEDQVATFQYQQPTIRFETNTATVPQFFLNAAGNIGVNTFDPVAKFEIRALVAEPSIALLQIKDAIGASLLKVQPDGNVGIGIDSPQAALDIKNSMRVTTSGSPTFVQLQPQPGKPVLVVSNPDNPGYSFDQAIAIQKGGITVQNNGGASISGLVTAQTGVVVEAGGLSVKGTTTIAGDLTLKTANTDRISVRSTGTTINGNVTLATGNLSIPNGTVTIGDFTLDDSGLQVDRPTRFNTITVRQAITLGNDNFKISGTAPHFNQAVTFAQAVTMQGALAINLSGQEKITLTHPANPVVIDLPRQALSLQSGTKPLVSLTPFNPPIIPS
ncbi:MAG: hypothetical protein HC881_19660 [Leptolyngbyaceae cyanobacterium SL_7_1]|nr:hypothetical protein [Leptolyngbyaceae cyanobacterium SL_7_1]